jgi:uncharacterized protein (DUF1330 family)
MMAAYWIARANLRDLKSLDRYAEIVAGLERRYPFEPLARSGRFVELEAKEHFERYYLHKFPSMEVALAMYNSPEYQEATAIRKAACDGCELVIVDGGDLFSGEF